MTPAIWLTLTLQLAIGVLPQISLRCGTCAVDSFVSEAGATGCCHAGTTVPASQPAHSTCECEALPVANLVKNEVELRSPAAGLGLDTAIEPIGLDYLHVAVIDLSDVELPGVSRQILFCTWLK